MIFQAEKLVMEQEDKSNDQDLGADSEVGTESDQENYESDYIPSPSKIRGTDRHAGVSHKCAGVPNSSKTFTHKQGLKYSCEGGKQKKRNLSYEFCPLPHQPSILRLLMKHFCQHPFLPEHHGQHQTAELIYSDSVHKTYLHCKKNQLHKVWAYLWMSCISQKKFGLKFLELKSFPREP